MTGYIMFWIGFAVCTWLFVTLKRELDWDRYYKRFCQKWLEYQIYEICDEVEAMSATTEW